jgi:ankyrin repeat protein
MALDPGSPILTALYHRNPAEAKRLAADAPDLTVFEAAALGDDERLAAILDRDASLANAWSMDGFTPLGLAAFLGSGSTVRLLLERGASIDAVARNPMKVQPLHAAVAGRNAEGVRLLLDRGADPNARQQAGYTPLMGAAAAGREDLIELLLARGADPSLVGEDGKTVAVVAREHGHPAVAARFE